MCVMPFLQVVSKQGLDMCVLNVEEYVMIKPHH